MDFPKVTTYDEGHRGRWDAFVQSNPQASYGHLSATFALAAVTPFTVNRSLMIDDANGRLIGVLPLFDVRERELRVVPVRSLVSGHHFPAGPLFLPHLTGKRRRVLTAELLRHVDALARELAVDRVAMAYPNIMEGHPSIASLGYLPLRHHGFHETNVVSMLLDLRPPLETLHKQMRERGHRALRKAAEAGVTVQPIDTRLAWLACHRLNLDSLGPLAWSPAQLAVIWDEFIEPRLATAHAAHFAGEIVSVVVAVHHQGTSYYWLGFNRKPSVRGANHCALWEAIQSCKTRGDRVFELGSKDFGHGKQVDISYFKESFGGIAVYSLGGVLERKPSKRALLDIVHRAFAAIRV